MDDEDAPRGRPAPRSGKASAAVEAAPALDSLELRLTVLKAIRGDTGAFEILFRRFHPPVVYYVRRIVRSPDSADDVMQEVWIAVFKNLPQLREPDRFVAWMYGIARNLAYQHLRKASKLPRLEPLSEELYGLPGAGESELRESGEQLHQALDRLNPVHREVLVLKYMEEMSYEQIAGVISGNVGTVRSRLHYAKKALLSLMKAFKGRGK